MALLRMYVCYCIAVCISYFNLSNLGPFNSQKIVLPNYVAGLIRCTSAVASMAPVCAVVSIIESRGLHTCHHTYMVCMYRPLHACMQKGVGGIG